jgi:hypothetical protein
LDSFPCIRGDLLLFATAEKQEKFYTNQRCSDNLTVIAAFSDHHWLSDDLTKLGFIYTIVTPETGWNYS